MHGVDGNGRDERTDGRTDGPTDGRMDRRPDGPTDWVDTMNRRTDERTGRHVDGTDSMGGWGRADGRKEGQAGVMHGTGRWDGRDRLMGGADGRTDRPDGRTGGAMPGRNGRDTLCGRDGP